MTRGAQLLLLLLASWLLSASPRALATHVARAASPAVVDEQRARATVEHAVLDVATPQVGRAPVIARVPAPSPELARDSRWLDAPSVSLPDLREALRRAQPRRRLPRLTPQEPPWC
jgi:hypothetical protein